MTPIVKNSDIIIGKQKSQNKAEENLYTQKVEYKSIDISKDLIVYGTDKSTGALFIYKRHPYAFFKAISGSQSIRGK